MNRPLPRLASLALIAAIALARPANAQIVLGGETAPTPPGPTLGITLGAGAPVAGAPDLRLDLEASETKPVGLAIPDFAASEADMALARQITDLVRTDLAGAGLFLPLAPAAYAQLPADISVKPAFADWTAAGAQVMALGKVASADGSLTLQFRLYDVAANKQAAGSQFVLPASAWRHGAHKIADEIYSKLTGATGYFDTRIAYVSDAAGGKSALNIFDRDGANPQQAFSNADMMRGPVFSPSGAMLAYSAQAPVPGKASQAQRTTILYDLAAGRRQPLSTLAPQPNPDARFSADGRAMIYSRRIGASNEIALFDIATGKESVLTASPASDTAPSLSPDGSKFVFVSDREGAPQLYVARVDGAETPCASGPAKACRITSGADSRPAWSPAGDLIAFERKQGATTLIATVRADGSGERLLTQGSKDTAPSWSPNGQALVFARDTGSRSRLHLIERSGRGLRELPTPGDAYEPSWGPLLK